MRFLQYSGLLPAEPEPCSKPRSVAMKTFHSLFLHLIFFSFKDTLFFFRDYHPHYLVRSCFIRGDNLVFLCRHHNGSSIAGGLVKGALSVAASAYKALFSGPPVTAQVSVWFLFLNFSPQVTSANGSPSVWIGN